MKAQLPGRFARILLVLAAVLLLIALFLYTQDYSGYFTEKRGVLVQCEIGTVTRDSVFERSLLTLHSSTGLAVECGLLVPTQKGRRHPAVILLGGKATGKHAIDYAIDIRDVVLIAPDYRYEPRADYTLPQILVDIPKIRRALLDMVPSVMLVTDYLFRRDDVDTTKLVLLGYSFGAPLVPVIHVHDRRAAVAAMVYGGGDLGSLITHNVRRYRGAIFSRCMGFLGCLLLRPLEPMRYVDRIAPTPLVMINGWGDEQIPRANAEMLYEKAAQPKAITWLESRHVRPDNAELTRMIIRKLEEELIRLKILNVLPP